MTSERKFQVFVSSTYEDMSEERQEAVYAILTAGHIPAGMELFTAGDESQLQVIKQWIESSDVFLLILGGRYGSIEPESGKSYIQLEYEHAVEKDIPLFAVVISDEYLNVKLNDSGKEVLELENRQLYTSFKDQVLSKMVKFYNSPTAIRLAIYESLREIERTKELQGWIKAENNIDTRIINEQLARLSRENSELREKVNTRFVNNSNFDGLTFDEMYSILAEETIESTELGNDLRNALMNISKYFGDQHLNYVHVIWLFRYPLSSAENGIPRNFKFEGSQNSESDGIDSLIQKVLVELEYYGIIELKYSNRKDGSKRVPLFGLSDVGRRFLRRLEIEKGTKEARGTLAQAKYN